MIVLYILAALGVIILILGAVAPKNYAVERSVTVDRPVSEVYDYIKYLKKHDEWSPWASRDPNMKKEFRGTDGEPGFVSAWEGNKQVGSGEQEIKKLTENKRLDTELRFLKPYKSTSDAYVNLDAVSEGSTKVSWGFTGENKFPMNIMMMFMNMDKAVGGDFEEGLASLKAKMEG